MPQLGRVFDFLEELMTQIMVVHIFYLMYHLSLKKEK